MTDRDFTGADYLALLDRLHRAAERARDEHREDDLVLLTDVEAVVRSYHDGLVELSTKVIVRPSVTGEDATRAVQVAASSWLRLRARAKL